jgi:lysophospholipase L1-like esterase
VKNIVCFGDSNTWGYDPHSGGRYPAQVRWPGALRLALGSSFYVIEEGLGGRTTVWDDPVEPFRRGIDYLSPCLMSHAPLDLLILLLGTNDTKPRFSASAHDIGRGMERLVRLAQLSETGPGGQPPQVLVIAPPHILPLQGTPFSEEFAGAEAKSLALATEYAQVAAARGAHFLDAAQHIVCSPLDAVHWSADAHHTLGAVVAETVRAIFSEAAPA